MKNLKDKITNVVAILSIIGAVIAAIQGVWTQYTAANPGAAVNWQALLILLGMAVIGWFTGKGADGKSVK